MKMETLELKTFEITENGFSVDGSGKVSIPHCKVKATGYADAVRLVDEFLETRSYNSLNFELLTPWNKIDFPPLKTKTPEQIQECARKQKELVDRDHPGWHFAPHDGKCYSCGKNIYQNYGERSGHTGTSYVTGCPHCSKSYCD